MCIYAYTNISVKNILDENLAEMEKPPKRRRERNPALAPKQIIKKFCCTRSKLFYFLIIFSQLSLPLVKGDPASSY